MNFRVEETGIKGLNIIETKLFRDNRGYFFETFNKAQFSEIGIEIEFVQDNISKSGYGVIRGLHYQLEPASQTKLLTVISGMILDVAVDLRKSSPTFGKHFSVKLEAGDGKMILIPKGFAHGFASLSDDTVILYKCDNLYSPAHERGIIYNDPDLNIDWNIPSSDVVMTERDLKFPLFKDAEMNF
ncbi:MAG: dTDP-4-dehydrorhamnose 3,5-epimerase [Candidatus Delongbacteria bacterium]